MSRITDREHATAPAPFPVPVRRAAGRRKAIPVEATGIAACALDMLAIAASAAVAVWLTAGIVAGTAFALLPAITRLVLLASFFHILVVHAAGAQDADARFASRTAVSRAFSAWLLTIVLLTAVALLLRAPMDVPRRVVLAWWVGGGALIPAARALSASTARRLRRAGAFDQGAAIVGTGPDAVALARYLARHDWLTLSFEGFYEDSVAPGRSALRVRGGIGELVAAIRAGEVDQVIIALPGEEKLRIARIIETLALTPVRIRRAPELLADETPSGRFVLLGAIPLFTVADLPLAGFDRWIKSTMDRVVAIALILFLLPLFAAIGLAIRLDSTGPAFFRQQREGFNCRMFTIWKFRTMRADADVSPDIVQACAHDPRVTRLGAVLRRTSIDELPQLLNVALGDMSLVGPRPHAVSTRAGRTIFADVVSTYPARHRIKPGITGWAQVRGWRGETDTEDKLRKRLDHDLHYIENWSLAFDLYILLRTVATAPFQRAAY